MAATPNENTPARTNLVNRVLADRYELLETLGEGPLLGAYRARDRSLNRIVTVKVLLPAFAGRVAVVAALKEGLSQTLALTHPAITRTYDVGTDAETGLLFVAEEYVRGIDLKERIRRAAPFQLTAAVDTTIALAEALEFAHARELAHGDVRPQNVLIGPDGQVKLTGWGVADAQGRASQNDPSLLRRIAPYISPDPARAQGPTASGDRYALGCVLFEMLTGETAIGGESAAQITLRHAQDAVPSPRQVNTGVPVALDGVVRKMLGKTDAERYAADADLLRDLRAVRDALKYGKSLSWSPLDAKETKTLANPVPAPESITVMGATSDEPNGTARIYGEPTEPAARLQSPPSGDVDATVVMPIAVPPIRREPIASAVVAAPALPEVRGVVTDEEREYVPVQSRGGGARWLLPLNLFLFLVVLASLAGVVYLVSNFLKATEEVIVPQLVGKTLTEAKTMAAQQRFTLSVVDKQFRDKEPIDIIYQMGTAPGRRIKEGKAIPIWVSLGPRMVEVPDVSNMAIEKARRILENRGLRLGEYKSEYNSDPDIPTGNVISQTPLPGENRPRATPINLILSKGPEPIPDPTPDPFDVAPTPEPDVPTPDPATPAPDATPSTTGAKTRYFDIKYPTPADGADHRVRIDVLDDAGPHTVFDEVKKSGEKMSYRVEAIGKAVTIKLYDNDELKAELNK